VTTRAQQVGGESARPRHFRPAVLSVLLVMLLTGRVTTAPAVDLTMASWGGAYTRSQILAFVRPYADQTGIRVAMQDYDGGLDALRRQVRSLNFKWDIIDLELSDAIRGCEDGLLEPIPQRTLAPAPDGGSAVDDFIPGSLTECGVGTVVWSTVIAYDRAALGENVPQRLEDFFDTERFPGPRGLRRTPKANLEWALLADGVPQERIYQVLASRDGVDRALRVLDRIKPVTVWWRAGIEAPRLLETGRVVMTSAYNGRIHDAVTNRDRPFGILWDHQVWNIDLLGIPRDNPRRRQALTFIRFATAAPQLAEQARHIPYGPVRRSALALLTPAERGALPTQQENFASALQINARWWSAHYQRINNRFEEWLQQPVGVPRQLPH
jgi:putative spermidine/putrescine transport system substrate-binding protein